MDITQSIIKIHMEIILVLMLDTQPIQPLVLDTQLINLVIISILIKTIQTIMDITQSII
jgi:hypothetical protein